MAEETTLKSTTAGGPTPEKKEPLPEILQPEEKEPVPQPEILHPEKKIAQSVSFKEESNVVDDLPESHKKALDELKLLVQEALNKHELTAEEEKPKEKEKKEDVRGVIADVAPPAAEKVVEEVVLETVADDDGAKTVEAIMETVTVAVFPTVTKVPELPEEVSIWGISLLQDERSDVVLLKFLRARDFKVKDAFLMIKNTIRWRKDFGIEDLLEEDLGNDLEKVVYMHGSDRDGHPVCYNVYGEFQNKGLYSSTFSDEKSLKFLRWRIQFLERSIRKLDFSPSGVCTIVQVTDLKNSPGPTKRELRQATNHALHLLQDNYPEFVAKQIFINVPWWYLAFNTMISPFLTQRTRSKFVFSGPAKSTDALFKYISPEQVPVRYGGLDRDSDEFTSSDFVNEFAVKPATKHVVEIPVAEGFVVVWELRVVCWDVRYGSEFVPDADEGYTVIVQKTRKVSPAEDVISGSFKIGEPGKVTLTIDNQTSRKKKLLYRFKTKQSSP